MLSRCTMDTEKHFVYNHLDFAKPAGSDAVLLVRRVLLEAQLLSSHTECIREKARYNGRQRPRQVNQDERSRL